MPHIPGMHADIDDAVHPGGKQKVQGLFDALLEGSCLLQLVIQKGILIYGLIRDRFQDATIVMVSHKGRSTIELQKRIYVEEGGAEVRE